VTRTQLRVLLILVGVIAFSLAMRTGIPWLRWVGIAGVAVALALRFLPTRPR
jgi:hypothetical protein